MENRKHTSLKDLAQALGVSIPTVSRALKDSPEISRELCAKAKKLANAPSEPLADGTEEITLEFGRGQTMYRNLPAGDKMSTGNNVTSITTTIPIHVGDTTETGALTDDITWSFRPAANTLSIDGEIPEGHKVLIACYDENGMLTKLEVLTISGSVKLPDSARIRVFYIDGDSKPLCAAATVLE